MANETVPEPTLLVSSALDVLPTLMRYLAYLPLILIAAQIISYVRVWYRLRDFKGPWLASFSESWMFKTAFTGQMHRILFEVCEQYGEAYFRFLLFVLLILVAPYLALCAYAC